MEFSETSSSTPVDAARRAEILENPGFGKYFTDHMVRVDWDVTNGWHDARVIPYGPLALDPATNVLHYGQAIFEGMKAYRHSDGGVYTFRPNKNAKRFQKSANRMAMPELPEDVFVESLQKLLKFDSAWVPSKEEQSLYLRPFMISTEVGLGVRPANSYAYLLIASPVGAYFPQGVKPVTVWISTEYVRAAPGGTGEAKFAGNYAASLIAQKQAAEKGCDQVVWIDAVERKWIEEMGGMNLFFVYGKGKKARIVTPKLTGTLLDGVTRNSVLKVAKDLGYKASEERISVKQWRKGVKTGEITEAFACGTAAVITPVGAVKSAVGEWTHGDGTPGEVTMQLRNALTSIQNGSAPDTHNWMFRLV
ncbi:MAG: putative branched-chain-amino-acid aminotransferase [Actinomycetota bacterium]|jgi:branched-chain amino acid aminotransferase